MTYAWDINYFRGYLRLARGIEVDQKFIVVLIQSIGGTDAITQGIELSGTQIRATGLLGILLY